MEIQVDIKDAELQMFHFDKSNELMGISLSIKNFKYHLTLYHPRETTEAERMWFYLDHNVLIENVRSKILVSQKVDPSEENRALRDQLIIREQNPFSNSEEEDEDSERLLVFGTHASMNDLNGNSKHGGELRTSFLISRQSFFFSLSQLTYLSPSFTASSLSPRNPGHQKESSLDYCEASSARESRHNSVHDFLRMALASTDLSNSGNFLSPKTPSLNQSRDSNESLLESPQSKPNFARRDRNLRPSGELESKVFVRDLKVLYSVPVRKSSSYWFDYFMVSQYSDPIKDSDSFKATDTELHPDKTKFQTKENQSAGPIEDSSFSNDPAFFDSNKVERGSFETSKYLKFKTVDVPHSDESRISDDSLMSINSRYRRLYTFEFSRPQVNLCSSETKGRMVLIAHTAKVETGAFALPDLLPQLADIAEDFEKDTADSGFREIIARKSPDLEFFKRTLFITLSKAQLLVAPIGIDMSLSAHWVPHKYFKSLNEDKKKAHSPHTTGLLEEITAPTVISFRYEYDTELPLIYSQTSERLQELFFRLNYSATSGDGEFELSKAGLDLDLGDRRRLVEILGKFLVPTSRMSIRFSPLDCFMTGRQFRTLVGVAHSLFIDPVGEEKDAIFAEIVPTKEQMISEILKIFKLHQELKNEPSTAWGIQKASELTTRKVEYIIESARIVLEDHTLAIPLDSVNHSGGKEERSGGFVVASLTGLHGVHQFYFNNSSNMFLEIEDLTLEDKVNGKIVFSKTISFEDQILISRMIPGASPLSKKEPLLRVFADACPPLLTDKVKSSREDEHINTAGSVTPALAAVTAWERFEIKLVPIQIDFSQDLYGVLRRYFFPVEYEHDSTFLPPPNPSNSTSYRNSFVSTGPNNQISLRNSASMSRKNSTREISIVSTKSAREPVEIPFTNYFKYLRINRVDIMASFQGFITFEDLQLRLEPFSANGKLWNWDKVVTKFEKHVRANVLGQATGIVKHTLGIGKSSQESRRRSRTPSKDTLLSINETRKYEPSLSAIDDSQTLEYSESKGQSFQHSEQEAEKLSQKRKSNALKKLMKRMGMSGTSGEKHQPQYDDDFEDASLSELR